jgi:hypothetical protein
MAMLESAPSFDHSRAFVGEARVSARRAFGCLDAALGRASSGGRNSSQPAGKADIECAQQKAPHLRGAYCIKKFIF